MTLHLLAILWNAVTSLGENKVITPPPPPPYFILWNAVTSLGDRRLYKNPPPYFIVLASSMKTKEVEVIEFHRINLYGYAAGGETSPYFCSQKTRPLTYTLSIILIQQDDVSVHSNAIRTEMYMESSDHNKQI